MSGGYGGYNANSPSAYGQKPKVGVSPFDPLAAWGGLGAQGGAGSDPGGGAGGAGAPAGSGGANPSSPQVAVGRPTSGFASSAPAASPFGAGSQSRYDPSSPNYDPWATGTYTGPDPFAGDRVGSVNYNATGNLANLAASNPQAAAMLRAQGLMPTINGVAADQATSPHGWQRGDPVPAGYTIAKGPGDAYEWLQSTPGQSYDPQTGALRDPRNPTAGAGMGGAGGAGMAGGAAGSGLPIEGALEKGYGDLISSGGHVLSPLQESALVNQGQDAIAGGEKDALDAAKLDAIRRGDTSGSTLGSREDRIRMAGTAEQSKSALGTQTGLREEAANRLMGALSGGTGLLGEQFQNQASLRQLALLAGQLGGPQAGITALLGLK